VFGKRKTRLSGFALVCAGALASLLASCATPDPRAPAPTPAPIENGRDRPVQPQSVPGTPQTPPQTTPPPATPPATSPPVVAENTNPPPPPVTTTGPLSDSRTTTLPVGPGGLMPPHMAGRPVVRVGVLLPFSSENPNIRAEAEALRASIEIAMFDFADANLLMLPRDAGNTAASAAAGAQALVQLGADVIIGPLTADSVTAAAGPARQARIPIIAFSTDRTVAGDGVYLLSFLPETEVDRVVDYAVRRGFEDFNLLAPENAYGRRVETALSAAARARGKALTNVQYYPRNERQVGPAGLRSAQKLRSTNARQAIMIPESGVMLRATAPLLPVNGVDVRRVRILGTGVWADEDVWREPALSGGWFAGPNPAVRQTYVDRYRAAYGRAPTRISSAGYDAMAAISVAAKTGGASALTSTTLENPRGFSGVDGLFRFRRDGLVDRGLAVLEVTPNGPRVVDSAPTTFATAPGS
jgi:branched-chain amino acid transport system substrate-binding protein